MRGKMILKKNFTAKAGLILILIIGLFFINVNDSYAKKKKRHKVRRSYNKETAKKVSLDLMRGSSELTDLAQIEPGLPSSGEVTLDENNQIVGEYGEDLAELEAEDNFTYDAENFQQIWLSVADEQFTVAGLNKADILDAAMELVGTPYRFGGITEKGMDCSAFTRLIYNKVADITLPRTAREQINIGSKVNKIKDLQFGDLIFFHTYSRKFASHVAIYLSDGLFIHAGTRYGVAIASLNSEYYTKRFIGGRRLTEKVIDKLKGIQPDENTDLKAAM